MEGVEERNKFDMTRWSSGEDMTLSMSNQGFDSPTGHHMACSTSG